MPIFMRYLISTIVVVLDQITKIIADRSIELYEQIVVLPVFNWTLHYNKGAAFSFLSNAGGWQRYLLTGISAVVSIVLVIWLARLLKTEKVMTWALALILGGAVGNLIDRVIYGHVIDFIEVHWKTAYFPSFNIADAAITVGTILLLWATFTEGREEHAASKAAKNANESTNNESN